MRNAGVTEWGHSQRPCSEDKQAAPLTLRHSTHSAFLHSEVLPNSEFPNSELIPNSGIRIPNFLHDGERIDVDGDAALQVWHGGDGLLQRLAHRGAAGAFEKDLGAVFASQFSERRRGWPEHAERSRIGACAHPRSEVRG